MKEKIQITAPIKVERKSKNREKAVANIIEFPEHKQPDLMYFSAILVSSGENLNHGHIYDRVYLDKKGNILNLEELASHASLDTTEMDIAIAGIIYKNRFPKEAEEVKNGEWAISMEAYFSDYDIKIGDVMLPRKDAEAMGITAEHIGQEAEVTSAGKVIADGNIARVLRNIIFAGCGIVKNPANPESVFLEAANLKEQEGEVINLRNIEDVTEGDLVIEIKEEAEQDEAQQTYPDVTHEGPGGQSYDTHGQCKHFGRFEEDGHPAEWCKVYDTGCTSALREQTDPNCLYYKELQAEAEKMLNAILKARGQSEEDKQSRIDLLKLELEKILDHVEAKCGTSKAKPKKKSKKMKKGK